MRGTGFEGGKFRTADFYQTNPSMKDFADFLKNEYGIGGHSGNGPVRFVNYDAKGIEIETSSGKENFTWTEAAKVITDLITLLAHAVGAGKSYEMIAIAMEGKRLGLHNKSLFAVPNSLTEQMGNDFRKLYPNANILVATKKDFERPNRLKLLAKIASNDWDAVIVGHSQFDRMGLSPEREKKYLTSEINKLRDELEKAAAENKGSGKSFTVKAIEKALTKYEDKLEKLNDGQVKDDFIDFEQLGFDKLFIDESHTYKNLATPTKMHNVSGLGSQGSARAFGLLMKGKYLDELTGGKGMVFASGTPIITGYPRSEMPILRCLSKRASQQVVLILIFILYFSKFSLHFLNGLKSISFVKK